MKRVVVKIGSNVLTRFDGSVDVTRISAIIDQIVELQKGGFQVILVSSGAVACGRSMLGPKPKLDSVEQRQLYSAVGQVKLMNLYHDLLRGYGMAAGQILTMKESFSTRREYLNQRSCMETMLANGVLPIVNENDTVSVTELMFTDNDELSGLVATMMDADTLVILSNVDGIFDGDPSLPESKVIAQVKAGDDISCHIGTARSGFGRGGMQTKYGIARKVASEGIRVIIANGKRERILTDILLTECPVVHTEFIPSQQNVSSVRKWIAHSQGFTKGNVTVDAKAASILQGPTAASLLPVGVTAVQGEFEEGDIIAVLDSNGHRIAVGRSAYNSEEAVNSCGKHGLRPIIHYDFLFIE